MSLFEDTYRTISGTSQGTFRDRGSKFIGYAFPLKSEDEVKKYLDEVKALHPKARHHCWALRMTPDRTVFRINDDGEPSGSAGRPILNTLLSLDLTNILVIVVRYFGGTLLGVPGLINAYKMATKAALDQAEIIENTLKDVYALSFDYLRMNDVMRIVKEESLTLSKQEFDNRCLIEFEIRQNEVERILGRFRHLGLEDHRYLYTC